MICLCEEFYCILFTLVYIASFAQTEVTGRVTAGNPPIGIPGVNVVIKGTPQGSITDTDGVYRLVVANGATLDIVCGL